MGIRHETYTYDDEALGFWPVVARSEDLRAARHVDIDPAYCTGKAGAIRSPQKMFRPGYFAGTIPGSNKVRILPRTYVNGAIAASATNLPVKDAGIFVVGEALSIIAPSARLNIASTSGGWAAGDTITVTIAGVAVVITLVAGDIGGSLTATNALVAAKVLATIEAHPYAGQIVDGLVTPGAGTSSDLVLLAQNWLQTPTLAAADTATNGTATASVSALAPNTPIATITAVNPETNTLTIGASAVSLPDKMPIGVATSLPVQSNGDRLGLISPSQPIDLQWRDNTYFALFTEGSFYRGRMPYWDGQLAASFPTIELV